MENLSVPGRRAESTEVETRFQALVQSPLRAALLRFMCARPDEAFDVEALMQTFGRMRLDIENCTRELVGFGLAQRMAGQSQGQARYGFLGGACRASRDSWSTNRHGRCCRTQRPPGRRRAQSRS